MVEKERKKTLHPPTREEKIYDGHWWACNDEEMLYEHKYCPWCGKPREDHEEKK